MELSTVISEEHYQQQCNAGKTVFQAMMQWREQYGYVDLTDEEVDSWRDRIPHGSGYVQPPNRRKLV